MLIHEIAAVLLGLAAVTFGVIGSIVLGKRHSQDL